LYFNYLLLVSTTYAYIEYYGIIHALYKFKRLSTKYNGHRLADNKTTKKAYRPSLFIREVPTRPPFPFLMSLQFQKRSALKLARRIILRGSGSETQASETKCAEACWSNYPRGVAEWDS
jgi:hypothetical protein